MLNRLHSFGLSSLFLLPSFVSATTLLNISYTETQINQISTTDKGVLTCADSGGHNNDPLGCTPSFDSNGGHSSARVGASANYTSFNSNAASTFGFSGTSTAAVFPQPGNDTSSVLSGYSLNALISPINPGDSIKFTLTDVNTCTTTLDSCRPEKITVSGASSIKGNATKGETITATGPVDVYLYEAAVVTTGVVPTWTETEASTVDINAISETAPKHHVLGSVVEDASVVASVTGDPVATPEPTEFALVGLLFLALPMLRRKKG